MFKSVGVIGIGNMGLGICKNLLKKVEKLHVFDNYPASLDTLIQNLNEVEKKKMNISRSISDCAKNSNVICLSLPR